MPVVSVFFGIAVRMFYREHGVAHGVAHFHAEHQGQQATFTFDGELLAGMLHSRTALRLIREWAIARRREANSAAGPRRCRMPSLPTVMRAEYRGEYKTHLVFSDGLESTVDFAPWLDGPVFEPLRDPHYFRRFFLEGGTVAWPNGADVAPETLYDRAKSSAAA